MATTVDTFSKANGLISTILCGMSNIGKPVHKFISEMMPLWWSITGRYNFTNLSRFGRYNEKSIRNGFERGFNWFEFNMQLLKLNEADRYIIGFDTTHLRKSGHKTPGIGYFWSGNEKRMQHGLEVGCLAAIDIKKQGAFSLEAIQTPSNRHKKNKINLVSHFVQIFQERSAKLLSISKHLVVDGYFMKKKFILPLCNLGFEVITKMRKDAYLQYLYKGNQKLGRPKKYSGKVDFHTIDKKYFKLFLVKEGCEFYWGNLFCRRLKQVVKIVYVYHAKKKEYEILLCTDLMLEPRKIAFYYSQRFQIEFLIREAKQNAGLEHCQARSLRKYAFHFNMSFSSVTVARTVFQQQSNASFQPFSMQNIKRLYYNHQLIERLFTHLGIDSKNMKSKKSFHECLNFGQIAA